MISLTTLLLIALVLLLFWGGYGYNRVSPGAPWAGGWSPLGFVLAVVVILYLTGHLH